jgi:hypothetical protein
MVYFIATDDLMYVKIGHCNTDVQERLAALQIGCPIKLELYATMKGSIEEEQEVQKKFKHFNIRGEWFIFVNEIKEFINCNRSPSDEY